MIGSAFMGGRPRPRTRDPDHKGKDEPITSPRPNGLTNLVHKRHLHGTTPKTRTLSKVGRTTALGLGQTLKREFLEVEEESKRSRLRLHFEEVSIHQLMINL